MSADEYQTLKQNAIQAIQAPYVKGAWSDGVLDALSKLEIYEYNHEMEPTAEALLESAIMAHFREQIDLNTEMSMEDILTRFGAMGISIELSPHSFGQNGSTGKTIEDGSTISHSYFTRPDPRLAQIMVALQDEGLSLVNDINTISIIPREKKSSATGTEPYIIIGITPWDRQIALCNETANASYVGRGLRSDEEWAGLLGNKTELKERAADYNIALVKKSGITDEKWVERIVHYAQHGVSNAKITKDTILEGMHHVVIKGEIPGAAYGENSLRPLDSFSQYQTMLNRRPSEGYPEGSSLKSVFLDDLEERAKAWREETGTLPDENCDDIMDPDHPSLSQITWKDLASMIKKNKGYAIALSDLWTERELEGAKPKEAQIDRILNGMYHVAAQGKIPSAYYGTNPLRPLDTFVQYQGMLQQGRCEGCSEGSSLKSVFLNDLKERAKAWREETGTLPDKNCDEIIDPDHPSLSQITWKDMATMVKKAKGYGFHLSEEWINRGIASPKTPQTSGELDIIDSGLHHLTGKEGSLPKVKSTIGPEYSLAETWSALNARISRQGSSLARFWMGTGLGQIEEAYTTPITAENVEEVKALLDDTASQIDLDQLIGLPSIEIIPADHPVRASERQNLEAQIDHTFE